MTKTQEIQIRQSEVRERINALLGTDDRSEAQEAELRELTTEAQGLEVEYRAAVAAEPPPDPGTATGDAETRERAEIRSRTGIADFLRAAATGGEVQGAAREFAQSCGCHVHGKLPLAIFPEARERQPEVRAITPGPAVDGMVQPHVPYVFERTSAAALGVVFKTVGSGQVQIPAVTTPPPADAKAKDGAAPNTAAAVSLVSRAPKRIAGQFEVRVEDLAVYPPLETVLQEAMRGAIGNETDEQTFNGDGQGENLTGLIQTAADSNVSGASETYQSGVSRFAALVDGRHAYGLMDVRAVIGPSTYAHYMQAYRGNNADVPLADYLMMKLGLLRVSDRMPAVANNGQKGIVTLMASGDPICVYVWDALEIIRDPYGGAGAGKVTITATALVSDIYVPHGTAQVKEIHPRVA